MIFSTLSLIIFSTLLSFNIVLKVAGIIQRNNSLKTILKDSKERETFSQSLVDAMEKQAANIKELLAFSEQAHRLSSPKEGMRVYAFLLQRGMETRLLVQPANTMEDMLLIANKEAGEGWIIMTSAYADVIAPAQEKKAIQIVAPEKEPVLQNFIYALKYSKDKFAKTEDEKQVIDTIITNIEKQHGRKN